MRIPRVFFPHELSKNNSYELPEKTSHHLTNVLRMKAGRELVLFNNSGVFFSATITEAHNKKTLIKITHQEKADTESPLKVHLLQGLSRQERMDYSIQKAVELGVHQITPIISSRCEVKFSEKRLSNKMQHWQNICISAAEQSHRAFVPTLNKPQRLDSFLSTQESLLPLLICHAGPSQTPISQLALSQNCCVLIGPEGGLSDEDLDQAFGAGGQTISLGPRVLRTETATVVSLTLLQQAAGDFQ